MVEIEKLQGMSTTRQLAFDYISESVRGEKQKILESIQRRAIWWNCATIFITAIIVLIIYLQKSNDENLDYQLCLRYFGQINGSCDIYEN